MGVQHYCGKPIVQCSFLPFGLCNPAHTAALSYEEKRGGGERGGTFRFQFSAREETKAASSLCSALHLSVIKGEGKYWRRRKRCV